MLRWLWVGALLFAAGCAFDQVWVRKDGKNIRNDEKLTQRFLRDNASCETRAARGLHDRDGRILVLGRDTEYGGYGGAYEEDQEELEREREMKRASAFRACMDEKGYEQVSATEADEKYGKRPEGFEAPF
jgi:hypothetical protein